MPPEMREKREHLQLCRQIQRRCICPLLSGGRRCGSWYMQHLDAQGPALQFECHKPLHTSPETFPEVRPARNTVPSCFRSGQVDYGRHLQLHIPRGHIVFSFIVKSLSVHRVQILASVFLKVCKAFLSLFLRLLTLPNP